MRGMWLALMVVVLTGCGGTMDPTQLEAAVSLVWHGQYHAPEDAPPPSIEVLPTRCIRQGDGFCVDGVFDPETAHIRIGAVSSYHASSLAHELYHADEFRRYGDCDAEHVGRGWAWYVPDAEDALEAAGL